ncbi:Kelch motif family protein [Trichomonas vaginalis G3]|uniref:Kelch motif family protein n=1 Tax=Trichomonas vaginalis (strain ATCC PRA-98 / G3) TaxID=412133 RepID=A2FB86_TRIV3|nr:nitrile biosynthetic process [Trichomonas vaginalis G3]EAX97816.1 Kelch motif family protein [Trichomonas vaginalis G3]KAI5490348.1 nitrile biosynthetic process [Trichomonas vaginalis G3]|eukprot:XP_001310746.1 Kelch motif family protein [Trichomonas vaginalis G3]
MHFAIQGRPSILPKPAQYSTISDQQVTILKSQRNTQLKSGFTGYWSAKFPESITPTPRKDAFCVNVPELDGFFIGYGITENKGLCDDVWFYNLKTNKWNRLNLTGDVVSPRTGTKAVFIANNIILFGGFCNNEYYSDLHRIDITTGVVSRIETTGEEPCPRCHCVMTLFDKSIVIWGGNTENVCHGDLYKLSLETFEWTKVTSNVPGRTGVPYCVSRNKIFAYGGNKTGLIVIDLENDTVEVRDTIGCNPDMTVMSGNMVSTDKFVFLFGGQKIEKEVYDLVYCLDLDKMWWFIFFLSPDGTTTSPEDGYIDKLGLFNIPNAYGCNYLYNEKEREIVYCLGYPSSDPPNVHTISISEALGFLHMRDDMLDILRHK